MAAGRGAAHPPRGGATALRQARRRPRAHRHHGEDRRHPGEPGHDEPVLVWSSVSTQYSFGRGGLRGMDGLLTWVASVQPIRRVRPGHAQSPALDRRWRRRALPAEHHPGAGRGEAGREADHERDDSLSCGRGHAVLQESGVAAADGGWAHAPSSLGLAELRGELSRSGLGSGRSRRISPPWHRGRRMVLARSNWGRGRESGCIRGGKIETERSPDRLSNGSGGVLGLVRSTVTGRDARRREATESRKKVKGFEALQSEAR